MRQYFLPVWGRSRFEAAKKDVGIKHWWDEPPLHYGHSLFSYVHWGKLPPRQRTMRESWAPPKECYIFGDSGGFTLRGGLSVKRIQTKSNYAPRTIDQYKLDPVSVLKWQISICTVGCVLDLPPKGAKRRLWEKGLDVTAANTARAVATYEKYRAKGSKFRWWGVIHGNNPQEQEEYYRRIADVYPFTDQGEGWTIRAEPQVDTNTVASTLRLVKRLGIKRLHLLAATGQEVAAVIFALGPESGLEVVSYDSAYAIKAGFNRQIFVRTEPGAYKWEILKEEGKEKHVREYLTETCECEACLWMRVRSQETKKGVMATVKGKDFGGWWSTWCQLHNLYIQQHLLEEQYQASQADPEKFLEVMLGHSTASIVQRIYAGQQPAAIVATGSERSLLEWA